MPWIVIVSSKYIPRIRYISKQNASHGTTDEVSAIWNDSIRNFTDPALSEKLSLLFLNQGFHAMAWDGPSMVS